MATHLKEGQIQRQITDLLDLKHIWWMRCNSGAMAGAHKGKRWFVRFGKKGMADLLASPVRRETWWEGGVGIMPGETKQIIYSYPAIVWIEVKRPSKKATQAQSDFAKDVIAQGHTYLLADSVDVVAAWLKDRGL